jgi:hypothetical protein
MPKGSGGFMPNLARWFRGRRRRGEATASDEETALRNAAA